MRRTKEDAEKTRAAILDAAEKVFYQQGVALTSLQEIAEAAACLAARYTGISAIKTRF